MMFSLSLSLFLSRAVWRVCSSTLRAGSSSLPPSSPPSPPCRVSLEPVSLTSYSPRLMAAPCPATAACWWHDRVS